MIQPNWEKAPEGATHYGKETGTYVECWYKRDEYDWMFAAEYSDWQWLPVFITGVRLRSLIPRPTPAWNGEGLPPVGTVCEHAGIISGQEWTTVEIVANRTFEGDDYPCAVFVYAQGSSHSSSGDHFRPIRTPAQVAANERENAVDEMLVLLDTDRGTAMRLIAEALYDKGYRLQE